MILFRAPTAHSFLHSDGPWGIVLQVGLTGLIFLHVAALVVLSECAWSLRRKLRWALFILLVPLAGPAVSLRVTLRSAGRHDVPRAGSDLS